MRRNRPFQFSEPNRGGDVDETGEDQMPVLRCARYAEAGRRIGEDRAGVCGEAVLRLREVSFLRRLGGGTRSQRQAYGFAREQATALEKKSSA